MSGRAGPPPERTDCFPNIEEPERVAILCSGRHGHKTDLVLVSACEGMVFPTLNKYFPKQMAYLSISLRVIRRISRARV
jgi:hypothetical protein